jgi:glycosyltransferase involved in cell wall biosynthesis
VNHLASKPRTPHHGLVADRQDSGPRIAIIIPACNEEACIAAVLEELLATIDPAKCVVAVGVNDTRDRTAEIARRYPVCVVETDARGYGYGCQAAIEAVTCVAPSVSAFIFFAADGASDPRDIATLASAHEQGYDLVLGARTKRRSNWAGMTLPHVLANVDARPLVRSPHTALLHRSRAASADRAPLV